MAHQIISRKGIYECIGESSELAGASSVMALINKAFALIVKLILLSAYCDCIFLFEMGIEFLRRIWQGSGHEDTRHKLCCEVVFYVLVIMCYYFINNVY
jgi:hypothetical protein